MFLVSHFLFISIVITDQLYFSCHDEDKFKKLQINTLKEKTLRSLKLLAKTFPYQILNVIN